MTWSGLYLNGRGEGALYSIAAAGLPVRTGLA